MYLRNSTIKLIEFQSTETEAINATVSDRNLTNQQGENKAELKDFSFNTDGNLVVLLLEMSASFIDVYNFVTVSLNFGHQ